MEGGDEDVSDLKETSMNGMVHQSSWHWTDKEGGDEDDDAWCWCFFFFSFLCNKISDLGWHVWAWNNLFLGLE